MKEPICCSFCGKPQGNVSNLVLSSKGRSSASMASICNECLDVCRKILVKSGTEPITVPLKNSLETSSKSFYRIGSQPEPRQLICSFCGTSQEKAHRLIGSPRRLPQTYICDKCVVQGDAAIGSGKTASFGNWIARKLGRRDTTVHHIE